MNFQHLEHTLSSLLEIHSVEEVLSVMHAYASDRAQHVSESAPTSLDWDARAEALSLACDALEPEADDSYYLVY